MSVTVDREQRRRALDRANEVRLAAAEVRAEVAAGCLSIEEALYDERAGSLTAARLIMARRWWGPTKTRKLLHRLMIGEQKRVGMLTDRQKRAIVEKIGR